MSSVIIKRPSEYVNLIRNYNIHLDGKKIGTIKNGENKVLDLAPGVHEIHFTIDWCGSQTETFEIKDGEIKEFKVRGFKNAGWLLPVSFILILLGLFLGEWFNYFIYLIIPISGVLFYYITFGRKNYLTLKEIS